MRSSAHRTILAFAAAALGAAAAPPAPQAAQPATKSAATKPAAAKPAAARPAAPAKTAPAAPPDTATLLAGLRASAVTAYNRRDWAGASASADAYGKALDDAGLAHAGVDWALVQFIAGHSRFETWKAAPDQYRGDYDADVLRPMEESLKVVQDDPFFKENAFGTALFERLKAGGFRDPELENRANWHMRHALAVRADELRAVPLEGEEYATFAKFVLQYVGRAFEMARASAAPDVYLVRVREACRLGFGTAFDARFAQLYQVIGFDRGNVRAAVLWQAGLDMMHAAGAQPEEVLETFDRAALETRGPVERAEVYRQMGDYASRQDGPKYKLAAVEYARKAFALDPANREIQQLYGSSLHVVSYAHFNSGRFAEALELAREATAFAWDGDEVALFDLSRAEANLGDKVGALSHAGRAYAKARGKLGADDVVPFRQNYVNILRQFGMSARAQQVETDGQGG